MAVGSVANGLARSLLAGLIALLGVVCTCAFSSVVVVDQLPSRQLPGLRADVATLIMQGASGGSIDMAMAAAFDPGGGVGETARVSVVIEVSGESLLEAARHEAVRDLLVLEVYGYLLDSESLVVGHFARRVDIDLDDWGERLAAGGVRLIEDVEIPGSEASIRALVLTPDAGRFAMAVAEVGDDPGDSASAPGRPRFEDTCDNWIAVSAADPQARSSAIPVWRPGERVAAFTTLARGSDETAMVFGSLRSPKGELFRIQAQVETVPEARSDAEVELQLLVPEMPTGVYSFTLAQGDGAESRAAEVWLVPAVSPEIGKERPACAWPEVMREARRLVAEVGPVLSGGAGSASLRKRAATEYLEILAEYGSGQNLEATLDRLVAWEEAGVGEAIEKNMAVITAGELEVVERLANLDPESLLPVFRLHEAAYQAHFEARSFGLAGHSRRLAAAAAEAWLARLAPEDEPGWGADALVGLAATSDRHLMFAASQDLLERAVEVDPGHREGRLLLAMLYEKLGEYHAAEDHLEEFVRLAPADSEGWLRLATIRHRLGKGEGCHEALRRVIAQRPAPRILAIAYQTLVRQLYAEEEFAAGLRALDEAELVLPGDGTLALARAYGLDRLGRGSEAIRTFEQSPQSVDVRQSFRLLYSEADRDLARGVERRLRRNVLIRQPRLGIAVAKSFDEAG